MNTVSVTGLNIPITQTITGLEISEPRLVERNDDGIIWKGTVILKSGDRRINNMTIRNTIMENNFLSFEELNAASQDQYGNDYADLTVTQAITIQGQLFANKMITALNEANVGITVEDVNVLVANIVSSLG